MILSHIIPVAIGGAIGAVARFGLSSLLGTYGVLTANIIGCFLIGAILSFFSLKTSVSQGMSLFLIVGILGGFTTFSAFSMEAISMIDTGRYTHALIYIITSVFGGLSAFVIGRIAVKSFI